MRQIRYSVANIYKSITITIPDGTTGSTFDIPLPVGIYTGGISVKLAIGDKEWHSREHPRHYNQHREDDRDITTANATVTTCQTTFVIEKGVTIQKLTVKGGNIRVNAGAAIPESHRLYRGRCNSI